MPTISFIGSGNVAWHLAPAVDNAGYIVNEIYSRNHRHAALLTERLYQAEIKATLDFSTSSSTIFIIAVNDDSIRDIVKEIILPENAILAHTSGSVPIEELQYAATTHIGVFYPLQTFSKAKKINLQSTPVFIESTDRETEEALTALGKSISHHVKRITSEERKALHVAAVFVSNFTNHMLALGESIMQKNSLAFEWLHPLIAETINKSLENGPRDAQTGPARRGDLETLERHMAFLRDDPHLAELYQLISQHIIDQYHKD